ncbi:MAG: Druantia anti-phage system protein DruA [Bacteroidota bacterium]
MLSIKVRSNSQFHRLRTTRDYALSLNARSLEEKTKLLVLRDLLRLDWQVNFDSDSVLLTPPVEYDKEIIRASMDVKRQEQILKHSDWLKKHIHLAHRNLAFGSQVLESKITPVIEVCRTQEQFDLFRVCRFYWTSPYSEYVGRRIKLLIRDSSLPDKPIIGIAALGSSIIHIPERDEWVGWDIKTRTRNLVYTMDAYILGALPPYNYLLGGKLVSYILASNEVRNIFSHKYKNKITNISKRKANRLACIFTTSLYGKSSQYNRIKFDNRLLYIPIGKTKGYGTLHLTDETFDAMRELTKSRKIIITNRFGDGPIWRMRVIRTASELLGFDPNFLLQHSFQRNIYAIPLAHNFKEFLTGIHSKLNYFDYPLSSIVEYWQTRWLKQRKSNPDVRRNVLAFAPEQFRIE